MQVDIDYCLKNDITRAVLVRDGEDESKAILGIISHPTKELHSNANLFNTLDAVFNEDIFENIPVGRYRLLHVVNTTVPQQFIYRHRMPSFDIVENN